MLARSFSPEILAARACMGCDRRVDGIDAILRSRKRTEALLQRLAHDAMSEAGCRCVLELLGLLATERCTWREGDLHIEIARAGDATIVDVYAENGGVRERALARFELPIALLEVQRLARDAPEILAPLRSRESTKKLVLRTRPMGATQPPPP